MPLPIVHMIGLVTGWLLWIFPNQKRKITYINLHYCFPDKPTSYIHQLARRSLVETAKAALEIPILLGRRPSSILSMVRETKGLEHLEDAMQKGTGVILAIPHLGNWEMIGLYCSNHYPMTSLYKEQKQSKTIEKFVRDGRERLGARLVPSDARGVRALYRALSDGELVAILPDQNPSSGGGVFAPFFNHKTNTMTLLSRLAQRNHSSVVYCYAERLSFGRGFRLHFAPASKEIFEKDLVQSATHLNQGLEKCIMQKPEQYWWSYKRFSVMPEGEYSPYKLAKIKEKQRKQ